MSDLVNIKTKPTPLTGRKYWSSLDQLAGTPQFREWVQQEFPSGATEMLDGNSRRTVLKMMAASFGLAGLAACSRPVEYIFPTATGWQDYVPGQAYFYTTVMSLAGEVAGLLVQTHDGRPTKIEGNPDHPSSLGSATALAQGSLLNLYDPDRSWKVTQGGMESSWEQFEAYAKTLSLGDGSGVRFLSETVVSPSLMALRADVLKKLPKAKWIEYESYQRTAGAEGAMLAFGQAVVPHARFDKAKVILGLDSDFLGNDWHTPLPTKQFAASRRVASEADLEKMSRLYSVESQFSLTGLNADHRLRLRGSEIKQFAIDLAAMLGALPGVDAPAAGTDKRSKFMAAVAKDLKSAGPGALVITSPRQPAIVHALAFLMNQALGSLNESVVFTKAAAEDRVESGAAALKALAAEMTSGQVSTLAILGGNPMYTAPADVKFGDALSRVAATIHLGPEDDETAAAAKWHLPEAHYLESWGDAATPFGIASIQQPMIAPIFGGRTVAEVLALISGSPVTKAHDIVKNYWSASWPAAMREENWKRSLNDGVIVGSKAVDPVKVGADAKKIAAAAAAEPKPNLTGLEVAFVAGAATFDGRFNNNAWMQEAPDPISKVVWDNAAYVSPATAAKLGVDDGDMVSIQGGGMKLEAAIMRQPGQTDDAITLALGYGRQKVGRVGQGTGFNANLIRTTQNMWYGTGFQITKTGGEYTFSSTQEHTTVGDNDVNAEHLGDRPVLREVTLDEYKKNPKVVEEIEELPELHSVYSEWTYDKGYQWGMSIDLGTCTGCNACVVACQAENNNPSVGKDQVRRGREMHWIRVDRYYSGGDDDPHAVVQPLPCMQCENAPCENVCPVAATTHSPEGLNDMVYNRCVGTRYCANNCPFKVRHFNFLNFHKNEPDLRSMVYNPDVTVRMRGVMEKCTYCVQRIQETRIKAKVDGRRAIKEGEIQTACQQTCPADAIVFGNINDPESRVAKLKKQERNYAALGELDIKPRTTYLARLRNPNPELSV